MSLTVAQLVNTDPEWRLYGDGIDGVRPTTTGATDELHPQTLTQGQQVAGRIAFEVPDDALPAADRGQDAPGDRGRQHFPADASQRRIALRVAPNFHADGSASPPSGSAAQDL